MQIEKRFMVQRAYAEAAQLLQSDEALLNLFPNSETEIVSCDGNRKTTQTHYRALGREGVATFNFDYEAENRIVFQKDCDGRIWSEFCGEVSIEEFRGGTSVCIVVTGHTKAFVPEFTIRVPLQEQVDEMVAALKSYLESGS